MHLASHSSRARARARAVNIPDLEKVALSVINKGHKVT
jgi:hypothetical protein